MTEKDFTYEVDPEFDFLVDEKGNQAIYFRRVGWGGKDKKIEIRKWFVSPDSEKAGKGVTFLTEEGPNELTKILVQQGFGHTDEVLEELKTREDFNTSVKKVLGEDSELYDESIPDPEETYYDPKELCLD